jgi:hypothetical protein
MNIISLLLDDRILPNTAFRPYFKIP